MITTMACRPDLKTKRRGARGFTFVELMISMTLSLVVLTAVLTTFLFLARGGMRMAFYRDMEAQSRFVMQQFGRDARQATGVAWTGSTSLTLTVEGVNVTYAYNAVAGTLSRAVPGRPAQVVARGITAFAFRAYDFSSSELSLSAPNATTNAATKIVQVEIDLARNTARTGATNQIISTRYMLRGKGVS